MRSCPQSGANREQDDRSVVLDAQNEVDDTSVANQKEEWQRRRTVCAGTLMETSGGPGRGKTCPTAYSGAIRPLIPA